MGAGAIRAAVGASSKSELRSIFPVESEDSKKLLSALSDDDDDDELLELSDENESRLRKMFEDCDEDGSGDMNLVELCEALKRDAELAREYGLTQLVNVDDSNEVVRIFEEADSDNSGHVCWDEFRIIMSDLRKRTVGKGSSSSSAPLLAARKRLTLMSMVGTWSTMQTPPGADVRDWHIDYWNIHDSDQLIVVLDAFRLWDCMEEVNVQAGVLGNFFHAVKKTYRDVPYHNFFHAVSTLHYSFKLVDAAGLAAGASKSDLFALIIGALCHDCDHRGHNTSFEVMTHSSLALLYNDRSPLENHHCAVAFELALRGKDKTANVFKDLDKETFAHVRERIVAGILGTDMKLHSQHVETMQGLKSSSDLAENGQLVVEIFMHTADIGNPLMPPAIAARWGQAIAAEFTGQVAEEAKLGLPISSMMTGLTDSRKAAKSLVGFIDFVLAPLAKPLFSLCSGLDEAKEYMAENLKANKQKSIGDGMVGTPSAIS